MPNTAFRIGDHVWCRHGLGYIMGLQHARILNSKRRVYINHKATDTDQTVVICWYMIGISSNDHIAPNITHVVFDTVPTLINAATADTITLVQNQALQFMQTSTGIIHANYHKRLYPGDLVTHDLYGPGIILSGGYHRPERNDGHIYHHVFYFNSEMFDYDILAENPKSINNMKLWEPNTVDTRHMANQIVRDCYLNPIFSTTFDNPVSGFISTNHMDFKPILQKFDRTYPMDRDGLF